MIWAVGVRAPYEILLGVVVVMVIVVSCVACDLRILIVIVVWVAWCQEFLEDLLVLGDAIRVLVGDLFTWGSQGWSRWVLLVADVCCSAALGLGITGASRLCSVG